MTLIEQLVRAEALAYLLETARIGGLIMVAPLSWHVAPARVRVGLTLALALVAHGAGGATNGIGSIWGVVFGVATELGLGLAMGFVVRLAVAVAEVAAEVIAPMMGLSAAHLYDPHAGSGTVLASLFRHLALLLALISGVHRVVLGALVESFRLMPVGAVRGLLASTPFFVELVSSTVAAGVRIAVPVVVILFMVHVALAYVSRAAPAIQIFSIGFAVTLGVGLVVLILVAPDMTERLLAEWSHVGANLETLVSELGAARP